MAKLRRLSGKDVLAILGDFGFNPVLQRGSHIKLAECSTTAKPKL